MRRLLLSFVFVFLLPQLAGGQAIGIVSWPELIDEDAQSFKDPYRDLTPLQFDRFRQLVKLKNRLSMSNLPSSSRSQLEDELTEIRSGLDKSGIDADWLIGQRWVVAEQRKRAASAGNPRLNGNIVSLAGFVIPGPIDVDGTQLSYLVPERGMCSHMPPPNPNQMVKIRSTSAQIPQLIYTPIIVSGRLSIEPSANQIYIVDGLQAMNATFAMEPSAIELAVRSKQTPNQRSNSPMLGRSVHQ